MALKDLIDEEFPAEPKPQRAVAESATTPPANGNLKSLIDDEFSGAPSKPEPPGLLSRATEAVTSAVTAIPKAIATGFKSVGPAVAPVAPPKDVAFPQVPTGEELKATSRSASVIPEPVAPPPPVPIKLGPVPGLEAVSAEAAKSPILERISGASPGAPLPVPERPAGGGMLGRVAAKAGIVSPEAAKRRATEAEFEATSVMQKPEGMDPGWWQIQQDIRQARRVINAFPDQFANRALFGIPTAIKDTFGFDSPQARAPQSTAEALTGGTGDLAGFIVGPAKVAHAMLASNITRALVPAAGNAVGTIMAKSIANEAATLAVASGLAHAGEEITADSLKDAYHQLGEHVKSGAILGAAFGGLGGVIPADTLMQRAARLGVGLGVLDVVQGTSPGDERSIAQKMYDYGLNTYFLWNGKDPRQIKTALEQAAEAKGKGTTPEDVLKSVLDKAMERSAQIKAEPQVPGAPAQDPVAELNAIFAQETAPLKTAAEVAAEKTGGPIAPAAAPGAAEPTPEIILAGGPHPAAKPAAPAIPRPGLIEPRAGTPAGPVRLLDMTGKPLEIPAEVLDGLETAQDKATARAQGLSRPKAGKPQAAAGRPAPVEFQGFQERARGQAPMELWGLTEDIPGTQYVKGSTVGRGTLEGLGYTVPPAPGQAAPPAAAKLDRPVAGMTFKDYAEVNGKKWPLTSRDPDFARLRFEFDDMKKGLYEARPTGTGPWAIVNRKTGEEVDHLPSGAKAQLEANRLNGVVTLDAWRNAQVPAALRMILPERPKADLAAKPAPEVKPEPGTAAARQHEAETAKLEGQPASAEPPAPAKVPAPPPEIQAAGKEQEIRVPAGSKYRIRFELAEADDLIPSHNPKTFAKDARYPEGVQNRPYHSDKSEQVKVIRQAQDFEPQFLLAQRPTTEGSPILAPDSNVVLSGNSRSMTVMRTVGTPAFENYRQQLRDQAGQFGLIPEQVDAMKAPVLVRRLVGTDQTPEFYRRFAKEANESFTQALNTQAAAVSQGAAVKPETMEWIAAQLDTLGENASLREFLRTGRDREIIRRFIQDGVFTERDLNRFIDPKTTMLNEDGKRMIERAILGNAIPDPDLIGQTPPSIAAKIERSLGAFAKIKGRGEAWDLGKDLEDALRTVIETQATGAGSVATLRQQGSLLDEAAPSSKADTLADALLRMKPNDFKAAIGRYADEAQRDVRGQETLGFAKPLSPEAAFRQAFSPERPPSRRVAEEPTPYTGASTNRMLDTIKDSGIRRLVEAAKPGEVGWLPENLEAERKTPFDTPEIIQLRRDADKVAPTIKAKESPDPGPDRKYKVWLPELDKMATPASQERRIWIVMGPPAAGKSGVLVDPIAKENGARIIDSDTVKLGLPESVGGRYNSAVHEESDRIAAQARAEAMRDGYNIVMPIVGKGLKSVNGYIDEARAHGYEVNLRLMDLPGEVAAFRTTNRILEGLRGERGAVQVVDPEYALSIGQRPRENYVRLVSEGRVDHDEAFSNDVPRGAKPRRLTDAELGIVRLERRAGARQGPTAATGRGRGAGAPEASRGVSEVRLRGVAGEAGSGVGSAVPVGPGRRLERPRGTEAVGGAEPRPVVESEAPPPDYDLPPISTSEAGGRGLLEAAKDLTMRIIGGVREPGASYDPARPPFFSALAKALDAKMPERASAEQILAITKTPGVKPDEVKWTGLEDWLAEQTGPVTKAQVQAFLRDNAVKVDEKVLGGRTWQDEADSAGAQAKKDELSAAMFALRGPLARRLADMGVSQLDGENLMLDRSTAISKRIDRGEGFASGLNAPESLVRDLRAYWDARDAVIEANSQVNALADVGKPKFEKYTLPGGQNYRELLLTLPERAGAPQFDPAKVEIKRDLRSQTQGSTSIWYEGKKLASYGDDPQMQAPGVRNERGEVVYRQRSDEYWMGVAKDLFEKGDARNSIKSLSGAYRSGHWDEPNVLASIRFNDRVDKDGKKVLFLEEIQSDWHQEGRRKGYSDPGAVAKRRKTIERIQEIERLQSDLYGSMRGGAREETEGTKAKAEAEFMRLNEERAALKATLTGPHSEWRLQGDPNGTTWKAGNDYVFSNPGRNLEGLIIKWDPERRQVSAEGTEFKAVFQNQQEFFNSRESAETWLRGVQEPVLDRLAEQDRGAGVPAAPFAKTWHELAFKRMLRWAAEHGYDRVAWTTGEQQAERYDLSKQVQAIMYKKNADDTFKVSALVPDRGGVMLGDKLTAADLEQHVGKDVAQRIVDGLGKTENHGGSSTSQPRDMWQHLTGVDLKVGGEGMKGFYDKILPEFAAKYGKKWGATVGTAELEGVGSGPYKIRQTDDMDFQVIDGQGIHRGTFSRRSAATEFIAELKEIAPSEAGPGRIHAIDITPEMRRSVLIEGQNLFSPESPYAASKAKARKGATTADRESAQMALFDLEQAAAKPVESITTPPKKSASMSASRGEDAGAGVRTVSRMIDEFKDKGFIDFRGQTVREGPEGLRDLANLAQIARDPRYETFRYFYVKGNEIVASEAFSSRLPGTAAYTEGLQRVEGIKGMAEAEAEVNRRRAAHVKSLAAMRRRMERLGADGYYLMHNHPSGRPEASREDMAATEYLAGAVPGFKGHVIINSGEFGAIWMNEAGRAVATTGRLDAKAPSAPKAEDPLLRRIGRQTVMSTKDLVQIGRNLKVPDNYVTLVHRDAAGKVRAIQEMPVALFNRTKEASDFIRGQQRGFGTTSAFAIFKPTMVSLEQGRRLVKDGVLQDAIAPGATAAESALNVMQGRGEMPITDRMREKESDLRTVRVQEKQAPYGDFENLPPEARKKLVDYGRTVLEEGKTDFASWAKAIKDKVPGAAGSLPGAWAELMQERARTQKKPSAKPLAGKGGKPPEPPEDQDIPRSAEPLEPPPGMTDPQLKLGMHKDVVDAAMDLFKAGKIERDRTMLISDQILDAIRDGKLRIEDMADILDKRGMTFADFGAQMFRPAITDAARRLGALGQLQRRLNELETELKGAAAPRPGGKPGEPDPAKIKTIGDILDAARVLDPKGDRLRNRTMMAALSYWRRADNIRRGLLVTQLATSVRNFTSQVGRLGLDVMDQGLQGGLQRAFGKEVTQHPADSMRAMMEVFSRRPADAKARVDALLEGLPREEERLFSNYASDLNMAAKKQGAEKVVDTALRGADKAVEVLNTFNRFQEYAVRRAVFQTELAARLRRRGIDLEEAIKDPKVRREIPVADIRAAIEKALELTFASNPAYGSAGYHFVKWINQTPGATFLIPFPRFMLNAMKFYLEFSPAGFLKFLSEAERQKFRQGDMKTMSRGLLGMGLLSAAYLIRSMQDDDTKWNEVRLPGMERTIDVRPLNPFASYLFVADVLRRVANGNLYGGGLATEAVKNILGVNVRGGTGLQAVDQLVDGLRDIGDARALTKYLQGAGGHLVAGLLTPLQQLTDIYSEFDPEAQIVRNVKEQPFSGPIKSRFPSTMVETMGGEVATEKASPTRAEPVIRESPGIRQATGITLGSAKNDFEKELDRLQIPYREILPSQGDARLDNIVAHQMGPIAEEVGGRLVNSSRYERLGEIGKRLELKGYLERLRKQAKAKALLDPEYREIAREVKAGVSKERLKAMAREEKAGLR